MAIYSSFVTTSQLARHLNDPLWIVIDCSHDLAQPEWGWANYQAEHIPGALFAHQDRDLAGPPTTHSGRHPLPSLREIVHRFSSWGIGAGKQVVVYDTAGGSMSGRLWWMLQYYGHTAAAILDGGLPKWLAENRPVSQGIEKPGKEGRFIPNLQPQMLADLDLVRKIAADPGWRLIDARAAVRYRGEQEPVDTVAGHIPGALNRFHALNLNSQGTILPSTELRGQFRRLLGAVPADRTVVYCGSGVSSALHVAVMQYAGLGTPRLYIGSWSEWIRDPENPVATGPESG